jgi:Clp amino terminal domain, pathogenicity island component
MQSGGKAAASRSTPKALLLWSAGACSRFRHVLVGWLSLRWLPPPLGAGGIISVMFERFTEKARRAIFFARYEASQYGSPYIESEHFLLGLLREDGHIVRHLLPQLGQVSAIREEIEAHIEPRERISTSVEVPLSAECKHILNFASDEAQRLAHEHVGTEHFLLGVLREEKCFAAQILKMRGAQLSAIRVALAQGKTADHAARRVSWRSDELKERVEKFLDAWSTCNAKAFSEWFVEEGLFVDVHGALWNGPLKIRTGAALHFVSMGLATTNGRLEELLLVTSRTAVGSATFEPAATDAAPASTAEEAIQEDGRRGIRMTVTLVERHTEWMVVAAHITAIQSSTVELEK